MANNATKNPMVLDTAGTITYHSLLVRGVMCINTSADHLEILKDRNGNIVWQGGSIAAIAPFFYTFLGDRGVLFDGLIVDTISAGSKIFLYTV